MRNGRIISLTTSASVAAASAPEQHSGGMSHYRHDYRYESYSMYPKIRVADEEISSKNPVRKTRGQLRQEERKNALKSQGPMGLQFKAAMLKAKQKRGR